MVFDSDGLQRDGFPSHPGKGFVGLPINDAVTPAITQVGFDRSFECREFHDSWATIAHQPRFFGARPLVFSEERGEESPQRAKYTVWEPDRTDLRNGCIPRHVDRHRPPPCATGRRRRVGRSSDAIGCSVLFRAARSMNRKRMNREFEFQEYSEGQG